MSIPTPGDAGPGATSTKPYLLRAIYEWCTDNGFTPYVAVFVTPAVVVPTQHVKNNEIVLNVSFDATQGLKLANDSVSFVARFGGVARDIYVPMDNIVAIYARENGQGMAFNLPPELQKQQVQGVPETAASNVSDAKVLSDEAASVAPPPMPFSIVGASRGPTADSQTKNTDPDKPEPPPPAGTRPALKRVK